jgi:hypothetical protein
MLWAMKPYSYLLSNSWDYITKSQEPTNSYKLLNKIVIYVCLPALALYFIRKFIGIISCYFPSVAWIGFVVAFYCFAF